MTRDDFLTEKEAVGILKKYAPDEKIFSTVYEHSLAVKKVAEDVCNKLRQDISVDRHLVAIGCILHDIGRFRCRPHTAESIKHGIEGAKILRKEKLEKCARIAECHIGIGIPKEEIIKQDLPLPLKDYLPETVEEKIITYADNLVAGTKLMDEEYVVERFSDKIGQRYEKKVIEFHNEIRKMLNPQH